MKFSVLLCVSTVCLIVLAAPGCAAKHRRYPEGDLGWHSSDYGRIFGELQFVPAKDSQDAYWLIRFDTASGSDPYGGKMVLMPENMMIGYAGGEYVELTGHMRPDLKNPAGTGMIYEVTGIRIWIGHVRE